MNRIRKNLSSRLAVQDSIQPSHGMTRPTRAVVLVIAVVLTIFWQRTFEIARPNLDATYRISTAAGLFVIHRFRVGRSRVAEERARALGDDFGVSRHVPEDHRPVRLVLGPDLEDGENRRAVPPDADVDRPAFGVDLFE